MNVCESLKDNIKIMNNSFETKNKLLKDLNSSLQINNAILTEKIKNLEETLNFSNNKKSISEQSQNNSINTMLRSYLII